MTQFEAVNYLAISISKWTRPFTQAIASLLNATNIPLVALPNCFHSLTLISFYLLCSILDPLVCYPFFDLISSFIIVVVAFAMARLHQS